MTKKSILVTGGAGYIGSHTIVELLSSDFDVVCIDNLSNSYESVFERIEQITGQKVKFYKVDACDLEAFSKVFQENRFDGVIHFAALKSVNESVKKPLLYYKNNILSTINLIELCNKYNVNNIVFSSSCTVYGQPDVLPVTEQTPLKQPQSPYGNTKKICEDILIDNSKINNDFNVIILRYFNPIGAHPSGLIGELPIGIPNNLMPYITQTAWGIHEFLKVYGNDYNTIDGTPIRDYIHIMDLASAHVIALKRILNKENNQNVEIFNLGTGRGYTVLEVIGAFEKTNNLKLNYKIVGRREGDVEKIWADNSLARKVLKWEPKYTLDDMVKHAWKWEKYYREKIAPYEN